MPASTDEPVLVVRMDGRTYAMRLVFVREIMRPLSYQPAPGAPGFVLGIAVARGQATPVLDLMALVGQTDAKPRANGRWVRVSVRDRSALMSVDEILGVRVLPASQLEILPPILAGMERHAVEKLTTLDSELVRVLGGGLRLPDEMWAMMVARPA